MHLCATEITVLFLIDFLERYVVIWKLLLTIKTLKAEKYWTGILCQLINNHSSHV